MFLTDPVTKQPSVTLTAFVYGFLVVTTKLILSGVQVGDIKIAEFSGTEFGAAVSALGAIYVLRRNFGNGNGTDSSTKPQ